MIVEDVGRFGQSSHTVGTNWNWEATDSKALSHECPISQTTKRELQLKVPHIRQLHTWDCGIACVLMALHALGKQDGCDMRKLYRMCGTTSIWTIDLAHLLHQFSLPVILLTITVGANPKFAHESFYKENMDEDCERVNRLFSNAGKAGICIQNRSVTGAELGQFVGSGEHLAILLVDKAKLMQRKSEFTDVNASFSQLHTEYTGHYVVVCGFDHTQQEFEIRDPASSSPCIQILSEDLDEARKAFGTDEDLLLVKCSSD